MSNTLSALQAEPAQRVCSSALATRPVLYTDTVGGEQTCRDDLWAVTTDELNKAAPKLAHGHRDDYYLMANCRRLLGRQHRDTPNWVIASELFATGSASAHQICVEACIDPYGTKVARPVSTNLPVMNVPRVRGEHETQPEE